MKVSYTSMSLEGHQSDKLPTFIHWLNYSFKIHLVSSVYFVGCFQLSWLIKSGWQITGWEGCQCFCTLPYNSSFNCKSKVVYNPLSSAALISDILLLSFGTWTNTAISLPFPPMLLNAEIRLHVRGALAVTLFPGGAAVTGSRRPTLLMWTQLFRHLAWGGPISSPLFCVPTIHLPYWPVHQPCQEPQAATMSGDEKL